MKNIVRFLAGALAALSLLASCDTSAEGTKMNPGSSAHLTFFASSYVSDIAAGEKGAVKIAVYRGNTKGELSVPVTVKGNEEGLFNIGSENVEFTDGQGISYVVVSTPDIDALGSGTIYPLTLTLDVDSTALSTTAAQSITVKLTRKLTWAPLVTGYLVSELFDQEWDLDIMKAEEGNIYRLMDAYYDGYHLTFSLSEDNNTLVGWAKQEMGHMHSTYGMVSFEAVKMSREGEILTFDMNGWVKAGLLYQSVEKVTIPGLK